MDAWKKISAALAVGTSLAAQVLIAMVASLMAPHPTFADEDHDDNPHILAIQHAVPHVSTVPANAGEHEQLFAWERVKASKLEKFEERPPTGRVVLFVHGGSVPSVPGFDLDYEDYSWMEALARAGFDVFSMD